MTIERFGITKDDVIQSLPIDSSEVDATTELTPDDVDRYIDDAGAVMMGLLAQGGIGVDGLDAVTMRQAGNYVLSAAVADCLDQLGIGGVPGYERYRQTADRIHDRYASRPETLAARVTKAKYSGDNSRPIRRNFIGRGYEF